MIIEPAVITGLVIVIPILLTRYLLTSLLVIPFFLRIKLYGFMGITGVCLSLTALVLYGISIIHFARPGAGGINRSGLYAVSRNPMYVAFFLYFSGACMLTRSWLFLVILVTFQGSVHFMILAEERWCRETFGEACLEYMNKVRRYL